MARFAYSFLHVFTVAALAGCAPSLDVPPAPEFEEILEAYERPTAEVGEAVMERLGDDILALREKLAETRLFDEMIDIVVDVQNGLDSSTDENGNLIIEGISFPSPNGLVQVNHDCQGWDPSVDDADPDVTGAVELTMLLAGGRISPVVWGSAERCRFLETLAGRDIESSFDGEVAMHIGGAPVSTGAELRDLVLTFAVEGTLGAAGAELPIEESFRVLAAGRVEILIRVDETRSFVYFFDLDRSAQGVRDATGTFACSLEERQCILPSGSFSW